MKKILIPTDFSNVSEFAIKFGIEIAKKFDASVTLITSLHYDFFQEIQDAALVTTTLLKRVEESARKKMDEFIEQNQVFGVPLDSSISEDHLVTMVKKKVESDHYDLIVMGTSGCSGVDEFLVGSVTEKVVRKAPCPVISVAEKTSLNEIEKVLVPIDVNDIREGFLLELVKLQQQLGVQYDFIWIKTPHNIENEEKISREVIALLQRFDIKYFSFHIVHSVFPSDGILRYAKEEKMDMIAMATHARKGISHWLVGSLTEDTINHINIPVWSFKMDKKEKSIQFDSVKNTDGEALYKKINIPLL